MNARFRNLVLTQLTAVSSAALILSFPTTVRGESSTEINGFSGIGFSIDSSSPTYTDHRSSSFASYQFTASIYGCSATESGGKVTLVPPSEIGLSGIANFIHSFDQPVDLAAFDYIAVDVTYDQSYTPVDSIFIYLTNGQVLELRNVVNAPFGANQTKFPIYGFVNNSSSHRFHPLQVSSLAVVMRVANPSAVTVDAIRMVKISPKEPLALEFALSGLRDAVIKANRNLTSSEVYRLEASHDLITWFDKSVTTRGDGSVPVFKQHLSDARFYRMSYYNYVDVSEAPSK